MREGLLFLRMGPHSQKKDLLLSLNRLSLLLGGPWALFCVLPSKGQQWCCPWQICTSVLMWLWADYLGKSHRECLIWSQPSTNDLETSKLGQNYAILIEVILVPSLGARTCNSRLNREHYITFSGYCLLCKAFSYTIGILGSCLHF